MNIKVTIFSIIALGFLALTFLVNWMFIIGAVILMILNQKELMKQERKTRSFSTNSTPDLARAIDKKIYSLPRSRSPKRG